MSDVAEDLPEGEAPPEEFAVTSTGIFIFVVLGIIALVILVILGRLIFNCFENACDSGDDDLIDKHSTDDDNINSKTSPKVGRSKGWAKQNMLLSTSAIGYKPVSTEPLDRGNLTYPNKGSLLGGSQSSVATSGTLVPDSPQTVINLELGGRKSPATAPVMGLPSVHDRRLASESSVDTAPTVVTTTAQVYHRNQSFDSEFMQSQTSLTGSTAGRLGRIPVVDEEPVVVTPVSTQPTGAGHVAPTAPELDSDDDVPLRHPRAGRLPAPQLVAIDNTPVGGLRQAGNGHDTLDSVLSVGSGHDSLPPPYTDYAEYPDDPTLDDESTSERDSLAPLRDRLMRQPRIESLPRYSHLYAPNSDSDNGTTENTPQISPTTNSLGSDEQDSPTHASPVPILDTNPTADIPPDSTIPSSTNNQDNSEDDHKNMTADHQPYSSSNVHSTASSPISSPTNLTNINPLDIPFADDGDMDGGSESETEEESLYVNIHPDNIISTNNSNSSVGQSPKTPQKSTYEASVESEV